MSEQPNAYGTLPPVEIEESVVEDIRSRREMGRAKYGKTMDRGDLSLRDWLQHAYEECLDQAIYLKRCIREVSERQEDGILDYSPEC